MGLFGGGNSSSAQTNYNTTTNTDTRRVNTGSSGGGFNVQDASGVTYTTVDPGLVDWANNIAKINGVTQQNTLTTALDHVDSLANMQANALTDAFASANNKPTTAMSQQTMLLIGGALLLGYLALHHHA